LKEGNPTLNSSLNPRQIHTIETDNDISHFKRRLSIDLFANDTGSIGLSSINRHTELPEDWRMRFREERNLIIM
jgi:hypothetical protein